MTDPREEQVPASQESPVSYPDPTQWQARQKLESRRKSVTLATVLSFLPGLGQVYTGYYTRGFVHAGVFAAVITMLANDARELTPLLSIGLAFFWFYNVIDAGRRAVHYNLLLEAKGTGDLYEEIELPGSGGSLAGGIVLMIVGTLFLLHTKFRFDMYWVEEWWPVTLIALGAYLFWKDRTSRDRTG